MRDDKVSINQKNDISDIETSFQHSVYEKIHNELIFFKKFFENYITLLDKRQFAINFE